MSEASLKTVQGVAFAKAFLSLSLVWEALHWLVSTRIRRRRNRTQTRHEKQRIPQLDLHHVRIAETGLLITPKADQEVKLMIRA